MCRIDDMVGKLQIAFDANTSDDLIRSMVDRFLCWKLPKDFSPDGGIRFEDKFNENRAFPMRNGPTGTNLFNARQAEEMVRHMLGLHTDEIILLDCPFCGADSETIDTHGWLDGDGNYGPKCLECGSTAESFEKWNMRANEG